jgi:hypothetical protein
VADGGQAGTSEVGAAIQAFVDVRKRPALALLIDGEELVEQHLFDVDRATVDVHAPSIDLLIDSGGGAPDWAFQMMQLLRQRFDEIHACVPYWAKSAATLLCLGSDRIVVGDMAQLGPLDTQVTETLDSGDKHTESALEEIKSLEQLRDFAADTFDAMVNRIRGKSEMELDEAMRQANAFVASTIGLLIEKLDPTKLGGHSRALLISTEYGDRLLRLVTDWDASRRFTLLHRLVYEYPSHGFAIGYDELTEMGLPVDRFGPEEMQAVRALYPFLGVKGPRVVRFIVPTEQPAPDADALEPVPATPA